jgi:cyclic pyranopterin monophosphate synthase
MSKLSHLDDAGAARMVEIGDKAVTTREAHAEGFITLSPEALAAVRDGTAKKGDVLAVARVAGIMAAKKTSDLIPLCHPIALSSVTIDFEILDDKIAVVGKARAAGKTGVEMEALTAVSVALLTLYDMVKSMGHPQAISGIRLTQKSGGKSGDYRA